MCIVRTNDNISQKLEPKKIVKSITLGFPTSADVSQLQQEIDDLKQEISRHEDLENELKQKNEEVLKLNEGKDHDIDILKSKSEVTLVSMEDLKAELEEKKNENEMLIAKINTMEL